jgi:hypothetical protein
MPAVVTLWKALCLLLGLACWAAAFVLGTAGAVYLNQASSRRNRKPGATAFHPQFWYQLISNGRRLRDRSLLFIILALAVGFVGLFLLWAGGAAIAG